MSRVCALLGVLALWATACATAPHAGPVPALCEARCFESCVGPMGDTGVRWTAAPDDPAAFDELGESVIPTLSQKLRQCELHRRACAQCLDRLVEHGVIDR